MPENTHNSYNPDIAIWPGEILQDTLTAIKMSQADLAQRSGLTTKTINEIIKGKNPITPETAIKLGSIFGTSDNFWNNLQTNYEQTQARLSADEELSSELHLLQKFSYYSELAVWGYVEKTRDQIEKVKNLQRFFGVSSLQLVPEVQEVAFRRLKKDGISKECLAAWLRCGEIDGQKITTSLFCKAKIHESLDDLKKLTREIPGVFEKRLVEICASFGVAVAFVPYFKKTYVNGATKWLDTEKALMQFSLRGSYDDIFWFTFFHELAHLLKHGKKDQFVEFENKDNLFEKDKEKEADDLARNTLIPDDTFAEFYKKGDFTDKQINNFAKELNISSSIVAGRLSYETQNWIHWAHLRKRLKFTKSN